MLEVLKEYVALRHDVLDLVTTDNCLLLEYLDRIVLARCLEAAQVDLG